MRVALAELFGVLTIRSLLDAPCGDGVWISELADRLDRYFGVDVVDELIEANRRRCAGGHREFLVADIVEDPLPTADAVLCRDCLVHLPLELGVAALRNLAATSPRYLIATTFPAVEENRASDIGGWRPLNLTLPPFNLPAPLRTIREREPEPSDPYNDKSLGVWDAPGFAAIGS